jgi:hypothetical protein
MCIKIHVAKCAFSDTRIHHVFSHGHLHVANSSPRVQWPYTWRNASGEKQFFFTIPCQSWWYISSSLKFRLLIDTLVYLEYTELDHVISCYSRNYNQQNNLNLRLLIALTLNSEKNVNSIVKYMLLNLIHLGVRSSIANIYLNELGDHMYAYSIVGTGVLLHYIKSIISLWDWKYIYPWDKLNGNWLFKVLGLSILVRRY